MALRIILAILSGYIFGNLNGAIITSNLLMHGDVRDHGSGNAGLTNFLRSYGGASTFLVLFIDICKAVLAGLVGMCLLGGYGEADLGKMLCGSACIIGHMFPVVYGFRGGKGILSAGTLAFVMDWRVGAIVLGLFLVVTVSSRYVSLGSLICAAAYPITFLLFYGDDWAIPLLALLLATLSAWLHWPNLQRLIAGTESKLMIRKKEKPAAAEPGTEPAAEAAAAADAAAAGEPAVSEEHEP